MQLVKSLGRTLLTLLVAAIAVMLGILLWHQYMRSPWTRDGRVSAEVVQMAPEVSGTITEVCVVDNQHVRKGDVLYQIDPVRFQFDVALAQARVNADGAAMQLQESKARRRMKLKGVVTVEDIEEANGSASIAESQYQNSLVQLNIARLDLIRSTIRSPVDGYVTNVRLRPGDYATAGVAKIAVLDAGSFWITGYFEETKLSGIRVNDNAEISLMGFGPKVTGHVESISRGIADSNDDPDYLGLPRVDPVFTWVRLAQRIPVRIHIDRVPGGVGLAAGMTCSVAIGQDTPNRGPQGKLLTWLRDIL